MPHYYVSCLYGNWSVFRDGIQYASDFASEQEAKVWISHLCSVRYPTKRTTHMARYSITLDAQAFAVTELLTDAKAAVIDAQIKLADDRGVRVEHFPAQDRYNKMGNAISIFHVFAHDGYHLIEMQRLD